MSQLTGFGQPHMSQHFSPMESGLSHQQNIHHLLHQEAQSIHHHQQQQQAALHQHRMAQASSAGEFMNQPGGVPCVKIVEQPAGNKLRFRLVVRFFKLFFIFSNVTMTCYENGLLHILLIIFRYECEGRSAGALHGVNYSPDNNTYPSIQILGYQ